MDEYVVYFVTPSLFNPSVCVGYISKYFTKGNGVPDLFADYPATLSESYMLVNPNPN